MAGRGARIGSLRRSVRHPLLAIRFSVQPASATLQLPGFLGGLRDGATSIHMGGA
jgi:hypothetical protein